jgi:hypothetical protein
MSRIESIVPTVCWTFGYPDSDIFKQVERFCIMAIHGKPTEWTDLPLSDVDGYFYQFIQSFDYYRSIDRRHNLLFKSHPNLRWEKPIHSQLTRIKGRRISTGYLYFHYGYVVPPQNVLDRWSLYHRYDSVPFDPGKLDVQTLFQGYENWMVLVPFRGNHPKALSSYFEHNPPREHLTQFTEVVKNHLERHTGRRWLGKFKEFNWRLRLAFRNFQARLACRF